MADITLSPIPYNGGTMTLPRNSNHYCQLTDTKFVHVVAQINPGYVYAYVANYSNVKTGTFSVSSTGPMRAVLSGTQAAQGGVAFTAIRVFRINNNYAMLVVGLNDSPSNTKMYVLEIGTGDTVAVVGSAYTGGFTSNNPSPALVSNYYGFSSSASQSSTGSFWQVFNVKDNVLIVADRDTSFSNLVTVNFRRIDFNPTTKALSVTFLQNYQSNSGANYNTQSFTRYQFQNIPGSTSKLISIRLHLTGNSGAGNMDASTIVFAGIVSDTGTITRSITTFPTGVNALCPLSPTTILGFPNSRSYFTWKDTTGWNQGPAVFNSTGSYGVIEAVALDANYFFLFCGSNTYNGEMGHTSYGYGTIRIGRFVDATFGQTSTATQADNGIVIPPIQMMYADQQTIFQNGSNAMLMIGRQSASSLTPQFRVIYQPGA